MTTHSLDLDEHQPAEALIHRVLQDEPGRACITSSFQAEDMVVLDIVRHWLPGIPVLFLDTGYHFRETYIYRDRIAAAWNLNLVNLLPATTVAEQERALGLLYLVDPAQCCQARKVAPLMRALEGFEVWFTGLRREQSPTRANLKKMEMHRLPCGKEILKVNAIADWNWSRVLSYIEEHDIELLPLYEHGYRSIGCEPCTSLPTNSADARSGRWSGKKLECGIHTITLQDH